METVDLLPMLERRKSEYDFFYSFSRVLGIKYVWKTRLFGSYGRRPTVGSGHWIPVLET